MKNLYLLLSVGLILIACKRNDQETPEPTDFGYLSMNITLTIEELPSSGRVEAVSTDDWKVTIFDADGIEHLTFDPFSLAPDEVQLPIGEYYIEAHSNNLQEAAFENPYYFGRSDNFTIDKEELKTIDIDAELANSKVAINYSPNVTSTFDDYTGAVTVVSTSTTLFYGQGETQEGYFVSEPLNVVVDLSYTKLDGTIITRQFTTDIDAQPKTLYNVNVDATLEDGKIVINLMVDEDFETLDIDLGEDIATGNGFFLDGDFFPLASGAFGCNSLTGFNDCQFILTNGDNDLCSGTQFLSIAGISSIGPLTEISPGTYPFSAMNSGDAGIPEEANTFIWTLSIINIPGFSTNCELQPGFDLWDTDQNGTDSGVLIVSKSSTEYTLNFEFQFTDGPHVTGHFVGPLTDLNN